MTVAIPEEVIVSHFNVSDAAREIEERYGIECPPRVLSNMLYRRQLDVRKCPLHGGRRQIPISYLDEIAAVLRRLNA
jgi:hypothetical protein